MRGPPKVNIVCLGIGTALGLIVALQLASRRYSVCWISGSGSYVFIGSNAIELILAPAGAVQDELFFVPGLHVGRLERRSPWFAVIPSRTYDRLVGIRVTLWWLYLVPVGALLIFSVKLRALLR